MKNSSSHRDAVGSRYEFYRDGYRLSLTCLLVALMVLVPVSCCLLYMLYHVQPPLIISQDEEGHLQNVTPLTEIRMTDTELMQWTRDRIDATCKLSWVNFDRDLAEARDGFNDEGWAGVESNFDQLKIKKNLVTDRIDMGCAATAPPRITSKSVINGRLVYRINIPYMIKYYGQDAMHNRQITGTFSAQVIRVDTAKYPRGVAIFSLTFSPGAEPADGER